MAILFVKLHQLFHVLINLCWAQAALWVLLIIGVVSISDGIHV
jgi:hypothetical protein